ncbi:unnamed protein product, partial [Brassica napus]
EIHRKVSRLHQQVSYGCVYQRCLTRTSRLQKVGPVRSTVFFFFLKIVSPNSKKLGASIMEVHCYKALHPYPFKYDDICSCMIHRGFTIAVI